MLRHSCQLYNKPRRIQSSWSKQVLRTMITLMLLLASIMKVEGNSDWSESPFSIQSFDCTTPAMINNDIPFSGVLWGLLTLEVHGRPQDRVRQACNLGTVYDSEERVFTTRLMASVCRSHLAKPSSTST